MPATTFPRGKVREVDGVLMRSIVREDDVTGEPYEELRPVALTLEEARATASDFYMPRRGWIRGGVKAEQEAFLSPND